MSDIKYQAGGYQPNQQTGGYQPNPSYPPQGPPTMAVVIPQPQQNYENFDKKKAKVWSIILLVLGGLTMIVTILSLGFLGIFAFPIPIVAGILGILSAKQPSQGKIVSFMILSIITAVIAGIMILICIGVVVVGGFIGSYDYGDNDVSGGMLISGIFGIIFYLALMIVSIYCSTLCCKGQAAAVPRVMPHKVLFMDKFTSLLALVSSTYTRPGYIQLILPNQVKFDIETNS